MEFDTATNDTLLDDNMYLKNNKYSLIGEMAYSIKFGLNTLSLGYKTTLSNSDYTINNFLSGGENYTYKSVNNSHYVYAEYEGTLKNLMYRLGLGGTLVNNSNDDTKYSKCEFTPQAVLSYQINQKQCVQLTLESSPIIPTISQLSNNVEQITTGLLRMGNPYLKSGNNYTTISKYSYNNDLLDFDLAGLTSYDYAPINIYYKEVMLNGNNYIASTTENAKSFFQYGGFYSFSLRPFKSELLVIKSYGIAARQRLSSPIIGKYSHWYIPIYLSLDMRFHNWGMTYNGNIVSDQIDGAYLRDDKNQNNLIMFYQKKSFRLTAGCYWLFTKSKYYNKTVPNNILYNNEHTHINDNRSMVLVGFSWNFSIGKNMKIDKKFQNKDTDKGTF